MLELRIVSGGMARPLFDLPAMLGRRQAAREIGDTIEGLIAFIDELGGDPDLEDSETGSHMVDATGRYLGKHDPREQDDDLEVSWPEWQSRGRQKVTPSGYEMRLHSIDGLAMTDDDEDDDPAEENGDETDGTGAEDDAMHRSAGGPGCPLADPGGGVAGCATMRRMTGAKPGNLTSAVSAQLGCNGVTFSSLRRISMGMGTSAR